MTDKNTEQDESRLGRLRSRSTKRFVLWVHRTLVRLGLLKQWGTADE